MYESQTFDVISTRMLNGVKNVVDKREGSVVFDTIAPTAAECAQLYIEADYIMKEAYADTASRPSLIKLALQRGLSPYPASYAIALGEFEPAELEIPLGSRFNAELLNYIVTEKIEDGKYRLRCETIGSAGNGYTGIILPLNYIDGLTSARITEILVPARDEEDTEELRRRYFDSFGAKPYAGNIAFYKKVCADLGTVGGVKAIPVWAGGGTVKLIVLDAAFNVASEELLKDLKALIDPVEYEGLGYGWAPIGHTVTIVTTIAITITVSANFVLAEGLFWEDVSGAVERAVSDYTAELRKIWADERYMVVRLSQIEARMLAVSGIVDITKTQLNGAEENVILAFDEIPVFGGIVNG